MADNSPITIRQARPEDADAISAVIVRALEIANARDYPASVIDRNIANNTPAIIASRIANDTVLVGEICGRLCGTAGLNGDAVKGVFVAPDMHGRGVGGALLREIERLANRRNLDELRLQSSITAVGFYQRHGFTAVRDVWFGAERTIVMLRRL
jgi:GNAT superfamily N-acetyltransferase